MSYVLSAPILKIGQDHYINPNYLIGAWKVAGGEVLVTLAPGKVVVVEDPRYAQRILRLLEQAAAAYEPPAGPEDPIEGDRVRGADPRRN